MTDKIPTLQDIEDSKDAMDDIQSFTYNAVDDFVDAKGVTRDTVTGRIKKMGFSIPIAYAGGIIFSANDNIKTVDEAGIIYAPLPSALPFTTSGTFVGDDDDRFYVVQSLKQNQVLRTDIKTLAAALTNSSITVGTYFIFSDRANGIFDVVLTSTVVPNTWNVIVSIANPLISFVLRIKNGVVDAVAFGADPTGATNASPAIQSAYDQFFSVDFGGEENTFWLADPVGLPLNGEFEGSPIGDIRGDKFIEIKGSGASIITDSAEAIWTSINSLNDPETTEDLFAANVNAFGLVYKGKTAALKTANIFNGDRLYNLHIYGNLFIDLNYIIYSFREKGVDPSFAEGYMQSVFFDSSNRVTDVIRIFKGSRAFNISMSDNFLEGDIRLAMDIQSDFGTFAIEALKINGNVYEGGGLLLRAGAIAAGSIGSGGANYFEVDNRYTALDHDCLILIDSSTASRGLEISTNHFLNSHDGLVDYAVVKFLNAPNTEQDYQRWWKGCSIHSNFSNAPRIVEQDCPIRDVNRNSINAENTYKSRAPEHSSVDVFTFDVESANTSGVTTGTQELIKIRFDSTPEDNEFNRNFHVKFKMRISHVSATYPALPAGKYQVGADYLEFDILFFFRQGFDSVDNGMNMVAKVIKHIPAVGSAGGGATYANFWGATPEIVAVVNGTDYEISMTGYTNTSDGNSNATGIVVTGTIESECVNREIISIGDMRVLSI